MEFNKIDKKYLLILFILFVFIGVISRIVDHIPNFTPIVGIALFLSYISNYKISSIFVICTLFISNLILGYEFDNVQLSVYLGLIIPSLLGQFLNKKTGFLKYYNIFWMSLFSSTFFYLITNFAVWLWSGMYTNDFQGLMLCYIMAIPFYKNTILGDLFSSFLVFGIYDYLYIKLNAISKVQIKENL